MLIVFVQLDGDVEVLNFDVVVLYLLLQGCEYILLLEIGLYWFVDMLYGEEGQLCEDMWDCLLYWLMGIIDMFGVVIVVLFVNGQELFEVVCEVQEYLYQVVCDVFWFGMGVYLFDWFFWVCSNDDLDMLLVVKVDLVLRMLYWY